MRKKTTAASAAPKVLSHQERGSMGGKASAASLSASARKTRAIAAVRVANSPASRARSITRAWSSLTAEEKAAQLPEVLEAFAVAATGANSEQLREIRRRLRQIKVIQ